MQVTYKLEWEQVSAIAHPEYYNFDEPTVDPKTVPDSHWTKSSRTSQNYADMADQYIGLNRLITEKELVRNVVMFKDEHDPVWEKILP